MPGFEPFVVQPMLNFLLLLYGLVGNFVIAIIIFTLITRLILLPFTISQQRNTQRMQTLGPQVQEIQKKYKDDPVKMQEELGKIGYGAGMLAGGCLPLVFQLILLYGLWQAITRVLAASPLQLLDLVQSTYKFLPNLVGLIPVNHSFLWLDLGHPDPTYVLPVLVAVSTYFSQKAFTPAAPADGNAAAMSRQMQIMMPAMLGWMALNFPSALSLYWVVSNLLAVLQYYGLQRSGLVPPPPKPAAGGGGGTARGGAARGATAEERPPRSAPATPPPIAPSGTRPTSRARKVRRKR